MDSDRAKRPSWATLPNFLTLIRVLGIPVFLWFVTAESFGAAVITLMVAGATDYFDGKVARLLKQESRLGELLDPAVDRLYIVTVLVTMNLVGALPLWVLLIVLIRDVSLGLLLILMKRNGIAPFKVTYLGKAATFNILYALPLILLTYSTSATLSNFAFIFGWSFAGWGLGLYLLTGVQYALEGVTKLRRQQK